MIELQGHKIYQMLKEKYDECYLDYVILQSDEAYIGYETHKKAVVSAFDILNERNKQRTFPVQLSMQEDKMMGQKMDVEEFLALPDDPYYIDRPEGNRAFGIPCPTPYWYAFLEPPYGNEYVNEDFIQFNNVLFPFKESLEVYRWNDDFSNYFDDGKEWWGTGCWSAYDPVTQCFVIILASLTD